MINNPTGNPYVRPITNPLSPTPMAASRLPASGLNTNSPMNSWNAAQANGQASMSSMSIATPSALSAPAFPTTASLPPSTFAVGVVNPADSELQKRFPGRYATLAPPIPFNQMIPTGKSTVQALKKWQDHMPLRDHELASLDTTTKWLGSAAIASLATLGLKQRILGVPEYLGALSWFSAMAITPKIINAMVSLKTGVNLEQAYDTSYGERKNLFTDPHYLPLHLLPDKTINLVADKLGIPANDPERRKRTEEKIRQISVQTNTWWMLVAGPATPVISGLICDLSQDKVMSWINHAKKYMAQNAAEKLHTKIENMALLNPKDLEAIQPEMAQRTQAYLDRLIGKVPDSELSAWWKALGQEIVSVTGVKKAFGGKQNLTLPTETLTRKIAEHFATKSPIDAEELSIQLWDQAESLDAIGQKAKDFLEKYQKHLSENDRAAQLRFIETRIANAQSTLNHYGTLFKALETPTKNLAERVKLIQNVMEGPTLSIIKDLERNGFRNEAKRMAGCFSPVETNKTFTKYFHEAEKLLKESGQSTPQTLAQKRQVIWQKISNALQQKQNGLASELLGASPRAHLLQSLQAASLRKLWQQRFLMGLGGVLVVATGIYTAFFVGRDFKKHPPGGRP